MPLRVPTEPFSRMRLRDLAELCAQMDASNEVRGFVTPNATFETLLQSLINHEHWFDAVSLLAHGMPPRSSVWWAALVCDRSLSTVNPEDTAVQAQRRVLELSRQWAMEPEEGKRQATFEACGAVINSIPAYWVGMSVFWATGNITPDAGVVTQPPPYLYARAASAAIDLVANLAGPRRIEVYEHAVRSGMSLAAGGDGSVAEGT